MPVKTNNKPGLNLIQSSLKPGVAATANAANISLNASV